MKTIAAVALLMLITGCSGPKPTSAEQAELQSFSGSGRDRLCIAKQGGVQRAGLIVYGAGDSNCSASGTLVKAGSNWQLVPQGEGACRIGLAMSGSELAVTAVPAACTYYCAPGATLAGKRFARDAKASKVTDLAGDPLC
jgi:hypothetical protein